MSLRKHGTIIGRQFSALNCIGPFGHMGSRREPCVRCQCQCGKVLDVRIQSLVTENTKSSGCMKAEYVRRAKLKHGEARPNARSPEYTAWANMIRRCEDINGKDYHHYGGRGIRVCRDWRRSFEVFLSEVGRRPSDTHKLERMDNDGNYEPGNVRWATQKEQTNNRRGNRLIEYDGRRMTATQWSEETGLSSGTIIARLDSGWAAKRILNTPPRRHFVRHCGKTLTIAQWARELGISKVTIRVRLSRGWNTARALSPPRCQ